MKKFFIMTRGRTGSTAIIDELSKVGSVRSAAHELFLKMDFSNLLKQYPTLIKDYGSMVPYELWKTRRPWWRQIIEYFFSEKQMISTYLAEVEKSASRKGFSAVGFKVLSSQFDETPFLKEVLLEHGYCAIYLKRNIARQVISGMIANIRGIHNTRKHFQDEGRYQINIEEFQNLVKWESQCVESDITFLKEANFEFIEVAYEQFMENRQNFFKQVLEFLAVPVELPQASVFSVMIKDLEHTIENFQEVVDCAVEMGISIE